jgi:non-ribosomal peptide synthase protein (TIGR01720 family)
MQEWPLTPNGKIDRARLPQPADDLAAEIESTEAPRDAIERELSRVWADLLQRPSVGVHDNFFQLGGDSILAIQMISKLAERGTRITIQQLFERQTIASLATVAESATAQPRRPRSPAGPIVATPMQRWLLDRGDAPPNHFAQAVLLEVSDDTAPAVIEAAFAAVADHHDAFRLRAVTSDGRWSFALGETARPPAFDVIDLATVPPSQRAGAIEDHGSAMHRAFDLETGRVAAAKVFTCVGEPDRLLLSMHHAAVDGVSWRVIVEDLERACRAIEDGRPVDLPPASTGLKDWGTWLERAAAETARDADEVRYWTRVLSAPSAIAWDDAEAPNTVAAERTYVAQWDAARTAALVTAADQRGVGVEVALVAALAQTFGDRDGFRLDVEGHGRAPRRTAPDLSRTVGWFTALYPLSIAPNSPARSADWLDAASRALRQTPNAGTGFGLLRDIAGTDALRDAPPSAVVFNFHGREGEDRIGRFRRALGETGLAEDPARQRTYDVDVTAEIVRGALVFTWSIAGARVRSATAAAWMQRFDAAVDVILQPLQQSTLSDVPVEELLSDVQPPE